MVSLLIIFLSSEEAASDIFRDNNDNNNIIIKMETGGLVMAVEKDLVCFFRCFPEAKGGKTSIIMSIGAVALSTCFWCDGWGRVMMSDG